jgi:peptidoglycan hydrolase-like protein with peptidoglycan-binding domain
MPTRAYSVEEDSDLDIVIECIRDFQNMHGLTQVDGNYNLANGLVPDRDLVNAYLVDLAEECETLIEAKNSHYKWSIVINNLKSTANKSFVHTSLPEGSRGVRHIENPLLTNRRIDLGNWSIDRDGAYFKLDEGYFIPKKWMYCFNAEYIAKLFLDWIGSSSDEEENLDPMTLLSKLKDSLLELDSRNSVKRTTEIVRKTNSLAILARTIMEEIEDNG